MINTDPKTEEIKTETMIEIGIEKIEIMIMTEIEITTEIEKTETEEIENTKTVILPKKTTTEEKTEKGKKKKKEKGKEIENTPKEENRAKIPTGEVKVKAENQEPITISPNTPVKDQILIIRTIADPNTPEKIKADNP